MTTQLRCPAGHEWDGATAADRTCPVCGLEAGPLPPSAAAPDATVTLLPRSAPEEAALLPHGAPTAAGVPAGGIPGFDIVREIGRGGMGVVYLARQIKLNRTVALKMILVGSHAGPMELARFRTEAEAVARLQHPHFVHIYEIGEADGRPYFSLEFVDGGSLADQLTGKPWPVRKAAALVETLARAMHHAHQRNVVHRDLKPANVLLTTEGMPKITDFGLAKQLDADVAQTPSDAILGTPSYMAPEQAGGNSKRVGPAADTYALGAILYELLTGQPPFQATTPLDTILQVLSDEPIPLRQLRAKVPPDLETICLKCLHKEPRRRYGSALRMAEDLHRYLEGEPIRARPVRPWDVAFKWARRNPAIAILIVVVALLFLATIFQSMRFR